MARLALGRPAAPAEAGAGEPLVMREPRAAGWLRRSAPWLVLGLALAFRLASLDLAAFTYDEADALLRARAVARGELPLAGTMTSWGFPDPPFQVYLLAPLALTPWPVLGTLTFMAVLNGLAVLGTYLMGARFFGCWVGLLAGLLYAVNPWAVYFGRRGWVQYQPLLTVVALWAAFEVVEARRRGFGLPFFLALAANVQARLLAACYAPAMLVSLALGGRAWLSRWSLLGVLGGLLLSAPYALYLVLNRERIAAIVAEGNRGVAEGPRHGVLEFSWWLSAGLNLLPTPSGLAGWLDALGLVMLVESWAVAGLLLGGLGLCLVELARRRGGWRRYALLLAWTILPLGLVALQSSTVYLHYLALLFPLPFLLMALALERIAASGRPLRLVAALLGLAVVLPQVASWVALQRTLAIYDTNPAVEPTVAERRLVAELAREGDQRLGTGERYGVETPVRYWLAAAERARAELRAAPRELLVATDGTNPLAEEKPAILEAMLGPDLAPRYLVPDALVLPVGRPALLLVTSDVETAIPPERLGRRRAFVPLPSLGRNTRDGTRLVELPPRSVGEWVSALEAEGAPGAGVFARRPERARPGEPLEIETLWVGPLPVGRARVSLAGSGRVIMEEDAAKRPAVLVGAGQVLVVRHRLDVPSRAAEGEYRVVAELAEEPNGPAERRVELGTVAVQSRQ